MIKKYFKPTYIIGSLGVISTIWAVLSTNIYNAIIVAILWVAAFIGINKISILVKYFYYLVGTVIVITVILNVYNPFFENKLKGADDKSTTTTTTVPDPMGTIYVEGETGILKDKGSYSYIGESARGGEAYLGDGGANATYSVNIDNGENFSIYQLQVRLSDDAEHDNGARNVTVTANGNQTIKYSHISENTNGWKWYTVGSLSFKKGENSIVFTKDESTSAAYVMDAFKLIPVN